MFISVEHTAVFDTISIGKLNLRKKNGTNPANQVFCV